MNAASAAVVLLGLSVAIAFGLFNRLLYRTVGRRTFALAMGLELAWLAGQGFLAARGVYLDHLDKSPPLLLRLCLLPAMAIIATVFATKGGRAWLDRLPLRRLTWLSVVRVPVEVMLFFLFLSGKVPGLMTFEGGNLDIFSGLTAPVMAWAAFSREGTPRRKLLVAWNLICLALLANIVTRAILSAPFPFQKLAFEQPNVAILSFPFIWLPGFLVPLVLFSHLASLRLLLKGRPLPLAGSGVAG